MIVDCHVHACAMTPGDGSISPRLRKSLTFRFARWRLGIASDTEEVDADEQAVTGRVVVHTDVFDIPPGGMALVGDPLSLGHVVRNAGPVLVGIVNELPCVVRGAWCVGNVSATSHVPRTTHHAPRTCLVNVSIPLPYEPFVVIRRVDLIDDRWVVYGHADDLPLVRLQNGPGPLPGRGRILEQLLE